MKTHPNKENRTEWLAIKGQKRSSEIFGKKGIKSNNKSFFKHLRSRKPARAYGKDIKGMLRKKEKKVIAEKLN